LELPSFKGAVSWPYKLSIGQLILVIEDAFSKSTLIDCKVLTR